MAKKYSVFSEFKPKKKNCSISVRITEADRKFIKKRKMSPTKIFNSKLKELKGR